MKTKALVIVSLICFEVSAQVQVTAEQIYYVDAAEGFSMGPIVSLQNSKNWYIETRYNYEDARTLSLYVGKAFSKVGELSYSITPIFGGVIGRYKGGSAGLNVDVDYKGFFIASQSQFTFSPKDEIESFFYSWSELGYQPLPWLYGGVAIQPIYYPGTKSSSLSPGAMLGFTFGKWSFPMYAFNPLNKDRAFVFCIVKTWGQ